VRGSQGSWRSAGNGSEILSAIALVRAGLYERSAKRFVAVERMFTAAGIAPAPAPVPTPEVEAFIAAEEALKQAA